MLIAQLHFAITRGHIEDVKQILSSDFLKSINTDYGIYIRPQDLVNGSDRYGNRALHLAISLEKTAIRNFLLEECHQFGMDLDVQNSAGDTPLHLAAYRQDIDAYVELLNNNANPSMLNNEGGMAFAYLGDDLDKLGRVVDVSLDSALEAIRDCVNELRITLNKVKDTVGEVAAFPITRTQTNLSELTTKKNIQRDFNALAEEFLFEMLDSDTPQDAESFKRAFFKDISDKVYSELEEKHEGLYCVDSYFGESLEEEMSGILEKARGHIVAVQSVCAKTGVKPEAGAPYANTLLEKQSAVSK